MHAGCIAVLAEGENVGEVAVDARQRLDAGSYGSVPSAPGPPLPQVEPLVWVQGGLRQGPGSYAARVPRLRGSYRPSYESPLAARVRKPARLRGLQAPLLGAEPGAQLGVEVEVPDVHGELVQRVEVSERGHQCAVPETIGQRAFANTRRSMRRTST